MRVCVCVCVCVASLCQKEQCFSFSISFYFCCLQNLNTEYYRITRFQKSDHILSLYVSIAEDIAENVTAVFVCVRVFSCLNRNVAG